MAWDIFMALPLQECFDKNQNIFVKIIIYHEYLKYKSQ